MADHGGPRLSRPVDPDREAEHWAPEIVADVVAALDEVVDDAWTRADPVGYFAAMYRQVTVKVGEGIDEGFFDDGERMARLDVVFARRYLDAYAGWRAGRPITRSWRRAFDLTRHRRAIVLQHLLLGINAHINLDLGIAAATTAPGDRLPGLRRDFDRINEILASMMARVRADLDRISPWIGLVDRLGGRGDDEVIRFSIEVARAEAWRFAGELAPIDRDAWGGPIGGRDARVALLADTVAAPGLLVPVLALVRLRESGDVRRNLDILRAVPPPDLAAVQRQVEMQRAPERR